MAVQGQFFITSETGPEFPVESLLCEPEIGLIMKFAPGVVRVGVSIITIPGGTVLNTDDTTNFAFVNSSGTLVLNTTGYPTDSIPLARVITSSGTITSIIDDRTFLVSGMVASIDVESASSEGESQTTSLTYVQKVRLDLNVPSTDFYTIMWSCGATIDDETMSVDVRVEIDDTTLVDEFQYIPKKRLSSANPSYPNFAGVSRISLTSGTHTIDLDFKTTDSARSVAIRRARVITIRG